MQAKTIIITGAANGIGRYLAQKLYQQGHFIVAVDIQAQALENLAKADQWKEENALLYPMDISQLQNWKELCNTVLQKRTQIDVLMNVAGIIQPGYIYNTDEESIEKHININLKGTIYGTKTAAEQMVKQKHGQIINVASLAGLTPGKGFNLYCASKFGVRGFSISAAHELREHNVWVSVVCPDLVDTHMLQVQLNYEESALVFSGNKILTVAEIGEVIIKKALMQKKVEIVYPFARGLLAKLSCIMPSLGFSSIAKSLWSKGNKKRQMLKKERKI
ncbi:MAG: SDR family oxidoreductase [Cytophagales bacterium]|nr:MAG: SDR family oxidoreductase [Cytophagales bacterium]